MKKTKNYEEFIECLTTQFQSPFENWNSVSCILSWSASYEDYCSVLEILKSSTVTLEMIKQAGYTNSDLEGLEHVMACQGFILRTSKGIIKRDIKINLRYTALLYLILLDRTTYIDTRGLSAQGLSVLLGLSVHIMPIFTTLIKQPIVPFDESDIAVANVRETFKAKGLSGEALLVAEADAREAVKIREYLAQNDAPVEIYWFVKETSHEAAVGYITRIQKEAPTIVEHQPFAGGNINEILSNLTMPISVDDHRIATFKLTFLSARFLLTVLIMASKGTVQFDLNDDPNRFGDQFKVDIINRLPSIFPLHFLRTINTMSPHLQLDLVLNSPLIRSEA